MTDDRIEMVNHDLGLFMDHNGFEYPIVCYSMQMATNAKKRMGTMPLLASKGAGLRLSCPNLT